MKILFVHQNFPGQFRNLAMALASNMRNEVVAIGSSTAHHIDGVMLKQYVNLFNNTQYTHAFARTFHVECSRAEQVMYLCADLSAVNFVPDVIVVHCGWGEAMPLRVLFPKSKIIAYCEMFYRTSGQDINFDPEFNVFGLDKMVGLLARNASGLIALSDCDIAISPTLWQRDTYPPEYHDKIQVIHEGIDIDHVHPDLSAHLALPDGTIVRKGDDVVTFVARNLEPLRGYHVFIRAMKRLLHNHSTARVIIIGGDQVSYGASPPIGMTWKQLFLDEVRDYIDVKRIYFLGRVEYPVFLKFLQISAVHVYLTYPFVLSWSLLEAMAAGCAVVASATAPVREVVTGQNGLLVDFFDIDSLAAAILDVLRHPDHYEPMRRLARQTIVETYERQNCVQRWLYLIGA